MATPGECRNSLARSVTTAENSRRGEAAKVKRWPYHHAAKVSPGLTKLLGRLGHPS